jgi:hypothetical protein
MSSYLFLAINEDDDVECLQYVDNADVTLHEATLNAKKHRTRAKFIAPVHNTIATRRALAELLFKLEMNAKDEPIIDPTLCLCAHPKEHHDDLGCPHNGCTCQQRYNT